jgi:hypothetical protein
VYIGVHQTFSEPDAGLGKDVKFLASARFPPTPAPHPGLSGSPGMTIAADRAHQSFPWASRKAVYGNLRCRARDFNVDLQPILLPVSRKLSHESANGISTGGNENHQNHATSVV